LFKLIKWCANEGGEGQEANKIGDENYYYEDGEDCPVYNENSEFIMSRITAGNGISRSESLKMKSVRNTRSLKGQPTKRPGSFKERPKLQQTSTSKAKTQCQKSPIDEPVVSAAATTAVTTAGASNTVG
jgi:hypothetical protein